MLNRKRLALLLAAAIAVSTLSVSATTVPADGEAAAQSSAAVSQPESTETAETEQPQVESAEVPEQPQEEVAADSEQSQEESAADTATDTPVEAPAPSPDAAGTLSFSNLDSRVRTGSLDYLYLEEMIAQVEAMDYEKLKDDLREGINEITNAQWQLTMSTPDFSGFGQVIPGLDMALQGITAMNSAYTNQALSTQANALREQFDALKEGKIQQQAADGVRQMRNVQDNIVLMAQAAYVQLLEAQAGSTTLERSLAALDRQLQELELRYQMGQISTLTLEEVQAARTSLVSSQQSLSNSLSTGLMNLENLMGAELTGKLKLNGLPAVTAEQLATMNLDNDLAAAKETSYTLYAAQRALDDAKEAYDDAGDEYNSWDYQYTQAQHAWQAAQFTYQGAVRSFELSFRTLHNQVKDYAQVLQAAKTTLAAEQSSYAAAQLKYEQGTISYNAMLTARDEVSTAQDKVATAERNLFSAYNNYRWAVDYGILN